MATTIRAVFDGEVFRPEQPIELPPATTYVLTVEGKAPAGDEGDPESEEPYVLTKLGHMATDMGIEDFAARHDWYAHCRLPDDEPRPRPVLPRYGLCDRSHQYARPMARTGDAMGGTAGA